MYGLHNRGIKNFASLLLGITYPFVAKLITFPSLTISLLCTGKNKAELQFNIALFFVCATVSLLFVVAEPLLTINLYGILMKESRSK